MFASEKSVILPIDMMLYLSDNSITLTQFDKLI